MELQISAVLREETGKGAAHRLRRTGRIPAILYGSGKPNRALSLDARELQRILASGNVNRLLRIRIEGAPGTDFCTALIKEIQKDPLTGRTIHLDFAEVALDHAVEVKVPVHITGEGRRINDGAVIEQLLHEVEVSCLPAAIPERIDADISALKIGESISVKDLSVPEGVKILTPPDETVVLAAAPTVPAEAPETSAPAAEAPAETAVKKAKEE